jgi:hypothetical protein
MARRKLPRFTASCYSRGNWILDVEYPVPAYGGGVYGTQMLMLALDRDSARALARDLNTVLDKREEAKHD